MLIDGGLFSDRNCQYQARFICERPLRKYRLKVKCYIHLNNMCCCFLSFICVYNNFMTFHHII